MGALQHVACAKIWSNVDTVEQPLLGHREPSQRYVGRHRRCPQFGVRKGDLTHGAGSEREKRDLRYWSTQHLIRGTWP